MSVVDEVTQANEQYAFAFGKGRLPMPPDRNFAVVSCMDARLDPAGFLGPEEGDAHVIRNAGGPLNDESRARAAERRDHPQPSTAPGLVRRDRLCLRRSQRPNRAGLAREPGFQRDFRHAGERLRDRAVLLRGLSSG
jgi:hypothetical protein